MKKRIISLLTAFCMVCTTLLCISASAESTAADNSADNGIMREDFTANDAVNEMGLGLNLGNTMEAYDATNCERSSYKWPPIVGSNKATDYEHCWGAPTTTQAMIDGIKAAGFNTVRIPVFWGNMMVNDGTYTINTEYLNRVEEIVKYCRNAGLYAVINIHHFDEFIIRRNDLESCKKIFDTLWTQIANHFAAYSDYVMFEGFNEYLGGEQFDSKGNLTEVPRNQAYELTNALNQTFVNAVRKTGGNNAQRILIISGYWTNIDLTTSPEFKIPQDEAQNKLMVSVHYVDNSMYWTNAIGGDKWMNYSIDQCEKLKNAFTEKGIPVFIGETTSTYPRSNYDQSVENKDSSQTLKTMLELITDYGFIPVLWDTPNNFYDRNNCKIKNASDAQVIQTISNKFTVEEPTEEPTEAPTEEPTDNPYEGEITGTITLPGSDADVTVEVTANGEVVYASTAQSKGYKISGLESGEYVITFTAENCAPRSYEVSVDDMTAIDAEIHLYGDVNGDGTITTADAGIANSHASEVNELKDYDFVVAEVTGDGKVTTADFGMINAHAVGASLISR